MHVQREALDAELVHQQPNLAVEHLGEEQARLDGAVTVTGGAGLLHVDFLHGTDALSRDLHQSELRQRQDVVLGAVAFHVLAHALVEGFAVFRLLHVDEVHDDDAAHVAQTQLAGQLVGGAQVHVEGVGFLVVLFVLRTVAAVHVHHVEGLRVFDDEIGAVFVAHGATERGFDLTCDVEVVEDGQLALVELHALGALGSDERHVVAYLFVGALFVHPYVLEGGAEEVSQQAYGASALLIDEGGEVLGLLCLLQGVFPALDQYLHLLIQLGGFLAFGHCAYDDAAVLGLDAGDDGFQPVALGRRFDFCGDVDLILEGNQHEESARKRDLAGQSGSFGGDGLFDDLHQHFLSLRQRGLHAAVFGQVGQVLCFGVGEQVFAVGEDLLQIFGVGGEVGAQIEVVDKGVLLVAHVDKGRIQPWHELAHLC